MADLKVVDIFCNNQQEVSGDEIYLKIGDERLEIKWSDGTWNQMFSGDLVKINKEFDVNSGVKVALYEYDPGWNPDELIESERIGFRSGGSFDVTFSTSTDDVRYTSYTVTFDWV